MKFDAFFKAIFADVPSFTNRSIEGWIGSHEIPDKGVGRFHSFTAQVAFSHLTRPPPPQTNDTRHFFVRSVPVNGIFIAKCERVWIPVIRNSFKFYRVNLNFHTVSRPRLKILFHYPSSLLARGADRRQIAFGG